MTLTARVSERGETFCELPEHFAGALTAELFDYSEAFDNWINVGVAFEERLRSLGNT